MKTGHALALCLSVIFLIMAIMFTVSFGVMYADLKGFDPSDTDFLGAAFLVGLGAGLMLWVWFDLALINAFIGFVLPFFALLRYGKRINILCISFSSLNFILGISLVVFRYIIAK